MKYFVIADENIVNGFSLFGVEGRAVEVALPEAQSLAQPQARTKAQEAFEKALALENLGALIISTSVANSIRPLIDAHKQTGKFPQILEI